MPRKYTLEIHKERLRKMLKRKEPCSLCPAGPNFKADETQEIEYAFRQWQQKYEPHEICLICTKFLNLPLFNDEDATYPCYQLGEEEAIKRTLIALENE